MKTSSYTLWVVLVLLFGCMMVAVACSDGDAADDDDDDDDVTDGDTDDDDDDDDVTDGDADDDDDDDDDDNDDEDGDIQEDGDEETETEDETDDSSAVCRTLELAVRDFQDAEPSSARQALAADFTVETLDDPWNFRENFSGCENYLFIPYSPRQNGSFPDKIWENTDDIGDLLDALPDNTHLFFVAHQSNINERKSHLRDLRSILDGFMAFFPVERRESLNRRLHYLTEKSTELPSYLGELMTDPGWGFGIDRFQRVRYIGSFADNTRYRSEQGWFAPNLSMVANEAVYYNFEAVRDEDMTAENATVVPVFTDTLVEDPSWSGISEAVDVTFPDAATMQGFDTLRADLTLACDGAGEYGTCPAWDYLVYLYLCDEEAESCTLEIGRWITTYHREGRWVHDLSPMLPYFQDGGTRKLKFYSQQPYRVTLNLRFSNQGKADKPDSLQFLWEGGQFSPEYNGRFEEKTVAIPADAAKVELVTVITGHGMDSPGNCAEFCNTSHHFSVNGTEAVVVDFPATGRQRGCMEATDQGVVPNQYGTWWYGRGGWCPGWHVPMQRHDITSFVQKGQDNTFHYQGYFQGADYPTTANAMIRLTSWVVVSH